MYGKILDREIIFEYAYKGSLFLKEYANNVLSLWFLLLLITQKKKPNIEDQVQVLKTLNHAAVHKSSLLSFEILKKLKLL